MKQSTRRLIAIVIAFVPLGGLRRRLYAAMPGYDIAPSARIGLGTIIAVTEFVCGPNVLIGKNNRLKGDIYVTVGAGTRIQDRNIIASDLNRANPKTAAKGYAGRVTIGADCLVNALHFIDGTGEVVIEDKVWLAGLSSQIWTHGLQTANHDVRIGAGTYIGAGTRIAPGVRIAPGGVVALGSVVLNSVTEANALVLGNPAQVVKVMTQDERDGRYVADFAYW